MIAVTFEFTPAPGGFYGMDDRVEAPQDSLDGHG